MIVDVDQELSDVTIMTSTTKRYCFKVSRVFIYIVSLIFPTSLWNSWRISKLQKTLWLREVTQLSKDYTTQYVVVWPLNHLWLSCDPKHCSSPGPSVHGVSQARIPEWVAIFSSGDLPDPRIKPASPALAWEFFTTELLGNAVQFYTEEL